jgi:hypothetical protein
LWSFYKSSITGISGKTGYLKKEEEPGKALLRKGCMSRIWTDEECVERKERGDITCTCVEVKKVHQRKLGAGRNFIY